MNKKLIFSLLSLVALTTACGRQSPSKSVESSTPASSKSEPKQSSTESSPSSEAKSSSQRGKDSESQTQNLSTVRQIAQLFYDKHSDAAITKVLGTDGKGNGTIIVFGGTADASWKMVIKPDHRTIEADTRIDDHDKTYNAHGIKREQVGRLDELSRLAEQSAGNGQAFKWILTRQRGSFSWKVLVLNGHRTHNVLINEDATKVLQSH